MGRGYVHRGPYLILAFLCPRIVKTFDVIAGVLSQQVLSNLLCFRLYVGLDLGVVTESKQSPIAEPDLGDRYIQIIIIFINRGSEGPGTSF